MKIYIYFLNKIGRFQKIENRLKSFLIFSHHIIISEPWKNSTVLFAQFLSENGTKGRYFWKSF
jgi:hypothetical protein